jgi:MFS family permease
MMALALALVGGSVPKARTGSAMSLLGTMSSIGTALGPSLGGLLIAAAGWRAIFLVNVPLGALTLLLAWRSLPADAQSPRSDPQGFDVPGTLLLGSSIAAYALAMTAGSEGFGRLNATMLLIAAFGIGVFALVEGKTASPLIRLGMLRDPVLSTGFGMSALVMTVMMATLVVGPFYLSRALGLDAAQVGLAMSIGPLAGAMTGVPAGRIVDRFGAGRTTIVGLAAMVVGALMLAMTGALGVPGYIASIAVLSPGYALFQTANNTAVMSDVPGGQRGVVSGVLNLSRNVGLITGASAMGALFAFAAGGAVTTAAPVAVAAGMRMTFAVAAGLLMVALVTAAGRAFAGRRSGLDPKPD